MVNLIINLSNKKKIGFIVMSIIIFFLSVMMVSYIDAKSIAIKSLHIVIIHDKGFFVVNFYSQFLCKISFD